MTIATDAEPTTDPGSSPSSAPTQRGLTARIGLDRFSGIYVWAVVVVVFGFLETETFLSMQTFTTVVTNEAITAMMTLALVIALASGVFDLSVTGTMTMSVILVAWLQSEQGLAPAAAVALTVLCGLAIGALNALIVVKLQVPSLIATLGVGSAMGALSYGIADGRSIVTGIPDSFKQIGRWQLAGVAAPVFYMAIVALVALYVLEHTPVGRHVYATGGNEDAARLTGIRTGHVQAGVLLVSSGLASITGIVFAARLGSASLDAGTPYLLPAFAAAFLGSTQVRPGRFNVLGTLVAIFLIATGVKGLSLTWSNVPWVRPFFEGSALVLAVGIAAQAARRRNGVGIVAVPSHD